MRNPNRVLLSQFRKIGYEVVDWAADYLNKLDSLPVRPSVKPGYLRPQLPAAAPERGERWADVMGDFERVVMPGVVHWQSPKFFAYFPSNASLPGERPEAVTHSSSASSLDRLFWRPSSTRPAGRHLDRRLGHGRVQLGGIASQH